MGTTIPPNPYAALALGTSTWTTTRGRGRGHVALQWYLPVYFGACVSPGIRHLGNVRFQRHNFMQMQEKQNNKIKAHLAPCLLIKVPFPER